jgi:serine/threonine protein kinase
VPIVNRIANYVPERLLASAGIVDTFIAHAKDLDRQVVLKVLFLDRAGRAPGEAAARRFLAVARRLLESPMPGTGRVLDLSDELEAAFVATELVPGVDLSGLTERADRPGRASGPVLDKATAGLICAEVARILAELHAREPPLCHLGLCPGNVVVSPTGEVTLLDVGLSASLRQEGLLPMDKWRFVAPEIATTDAWSLASEAAIAADLHALGTILCFLLGGGLPGAAASLRELSGRKIDAFPELTGAPTQLRAAVRALTAPDPRDRPDSANAVVAWLSSGMESKEDRRVHIAKALQSLENTHADATNSPRTVAPARRDREAQAAPVRGSAVATTRRRGPRRFLAAFLVTLVVAAGGIVVWNAFRHRAPSPGSLAHRSKTETPPASRLQLGQQEIIAPTSAGGGPPDNVPDQLGDRVYLPGPKQKLPRVRGHLFLATNPDQADVWIDGTLKGKSPVDLAIGPGGHRVVVIKAGHRMFRAVYDTTDGEYVRKELQRVAAPTVGDALLNVECREPNKYPVFLDDEETGLLCPVAKLRVAAGKHSVGVFVPVKKTVVAVEVVAERREQPVRVLLKE